MMADKPDSVNLNDDDVVTSDEAYTIHHSRRWLSLVIYFIMALAFAVLVVFGGRWLYHKLHKSKTSTTNTTTTSQSSNSNSSPATPATPSTPSTPSNNSSGSNSQTQTTTPATGTVPNTGPGNIVALFIGTAVVIGGLHFVYNLRRV